MICNISIHKVICVSISERFSINLLNVSRLASCEALLTNCSKNDKNLNKWTFDDFRRNSEQWVCDWPYPASSLGLINSRLTKIVDHPEIVDQKSWMLTKTGNSSASPWSATSGGKKGDEHGQVPLFLRLGAGWGGTRGHARPSLLLLFSHLGAFSQSLGMH